MISLIIEGGGGGLIDKGRRAGELTSVIDADEACVFEDVVVLVEDFLALHHRNGLDHASHAS